MRNVRCADCDEYRNEWCEKVVDSPHPDMIRDCPYWHERKDLVEVIRCKDCKHWEKVLFDIGICQNMSLDVMVWWIGDDFCSRAERKDGEAE